MLKLDKEQLRNEITAARAWRDKHLASWSDQVNRFSGSSYKDSYTGAGMSPAADPENFAYS